MCYCNEYEFTINRADEFMVMEKTENQWYNIDPETLVKLIKHNLNNDVLKIVWQENNFKQVKMNT